MRLVIVASILLTGCVGVHPNLQPPVDVSIIPNDCGNKQQIIRWLENQAKLPQMQLESKEQYENTRGQFKARIWSLRYHCDRV